MNPLTLLQLISPMIRKMPRKEAKRFLASLKGEGLYTSSGLRMAQQGKNPQKAFNRAETSGRRVDEILDLFSEMGGDVDGNQMEDVRDIMANLMNKRSGKF